MVLGDYGRTWQGRTLSWAAISTPENIARLEEIKANSLALSDPRRTTPAEARALIARQPVIVWLAYSVHGNEAGPAEAAMGVARHLLASSDPRVQAMLRDAVVLLVPNQNPDGRDRFITTHEAARGLEVDSDPQSAERSQRA
jgi:murein tripeptide amidase MpaA